MENRALRRTFSYSASVQLNYEVVGHGATPIVFLHGFAASLVTWNDIRGFFPPERFRLYLLDLKGFGFSSKPRDGRYAPDDQAAVVSAFLEREKLRQAVLVGHSLGGGIALLVLLQAQAAGWHDLVDRLILIDCAAYPQRLPRSMRWLRVPLLGWGILHLLPFRFMVRYTFAYVYHDRQTVTPERKARYLGCFSPSGIAYVFIRTCRQLTPEKSADLITAIRGITIPTLIVWGRQDRVIPLRCGQRLHKDIPGSRLVLIDDCGHIPHEERPQETWAAIREFLKSRDSGFQR
jgi:pimeloyl-ACP methyl ester carboxylesterase